MATLACMTGFVVADKDAESFGRELATEGVSRARVLAMLDEAAEKAGCEVTGWTQDAALRGYDAVSSGECSGEDARMMLTYTYTIFDGNPSASGPCAWPSHEDLEIEAATAAEALERVLQVAKSEGERCRQYDVGDQLWAVVWDENGVNVASGSVEIEA